MVSYNRSFLFLHAKKTFTFKINNLFTDIKTANKLWLVNRDYLNIYNG